VNFFCFKINNRNKERRRKSGEEEERAKPMTKCITFVAKRGRMRIDFIRIKMGFLEWPKGKVENYNPQKAGTTESGKESLLEHTSHKREFYGSFWGKIGI